MISLPKKVFYFILALTLVFSLRAIPALAANPQDIFLDTSMDAYNQQNREVYDTAGLEGSTQHWDGGSAQRYTGLLLPASLANAIICFDEPFCKNRSTALGTITLAITQIYANPPASVTYYAQDLLQNSGLLAKPAYAQGLGFAGLSPLLPLWKVTRNIAYSAVIFVMIIIGFMVIFRAKIDPKTVISVQAAIPKIIITLLLITFSYPIAGFMVDLMYLSIGIVVSMLSQGFGQGWDTTRLQTYFLTADAGDLLKTVFTGGVHTFDDFISKNVGAYGVVGGSVFAVTGAMRWLSLVPAAWVGALGIGAILGLVLALGLLFTFIRILLLLLNSYIQLLIAVVIGPFHLLFEAIPGKSAFSEWILNIAANLVVFPTTVAVLMFAEFFAKMNADSSGLFSPPFTWVPGKGAFPAFLSLGIMFLAPTLIATVKKQFHPKPLLPITAGTAFAPLTGATQTTMGAASQFYYLQSTLANFGPLKGFFGGGHGQHK